MRSEAELWKKYEEQIELAKGEATGIGPRRVIGASLRSVPLLILEWVLGLNGEKPNEEIIYTEYVNVVEHRPKFEKGMRAARIPFVERNMKASWLAWILDISAEDMKKHLRYHEIK
jgi:hypothetical protein